MITGAPLPRWRELARLATPLPDPATMAAPWTRPGDRFVWFSRSSWALHALAQAWTGHHRRPPRLWVPDYFCNATLDPVRRTGAMLHFYPVTEDLRPDWTACDAQDSPCDLFLLAHFFGFPSDGPGARAFCDRRDALLIEDCAHALMPAPGLGGLGDVELWSPHKLLAAPMGGLLVARGKAGDLVRPPAGAAPTIRTWLVKRLVQKLVPSWMLPPATRNGPQRFADDPITGPMPETPAPSAAGLKLLAGATTGLNRAISARRHLGAMLATTLERRPGWRRLFDPAAVTPYRLVMRCDDPAVAAERFDQYRAVGIPVESWPDMPPEVTAAPAHHTVALTLRATILCFPVHQGLPDTVMAARCSSVMAAMQEGGDFCRQLR